MQTELIPRDEKGRRHGLWVERYITKNQIMSKGEYIHGKKHGTWIGYHKDGSIWYKDTYDIGKLIGYSVQYWDYKFIYKRFYAR
jgi:antitoxin component YwqK of YwqJK toxin-antitoxin module